MKILGISWSLQGSEKPGFHKVSGRFLLFVSTFILLLLHISSCVIVSDGYDWAIGKIYVAQGSGDKIEFISKDRFIFTWGTATKYQHVANRSREFTYGLTEEGNIFPVLISSTVFIFPYSALSFSGIAEIIGVDRDGNIVTFHLSDSSEKDCPAEEEARHGKVLRLDENQQELNKVIIASSNQFVRWVHVETGRTMFGTDEIVRFDWNKQIFELTPQGSRYFSSFPKNSLSEAFELKVGEKTVYSGLLISTFSSAIYKAPVIVFWHEMDGNMRPLQFRIFDGYPGGYEEANVRFSKPLKEALKQADVLADISIQDSYIVNERE